MTVLVTGAAGFIGFHVAGALLRRGERVVGVDSFDPYYDVGLKEARLGLLAPQPGFTMVRGDLAEPATLDQVLAAHPGVDRIVHLAAQAGVRYSLENPRAYIRANVGGHLEVLEAARALPGLKRMVYASTSSVYGANAKRPYAVTDPVEQPVSLYAATKRADELMSRVYAHLYGIPLVGLRFFTVYGPWGRPDMAYFLFARAISEGRPIRLFGNGTLLRDFTHVDDVVAGVLAALDRPLPWGDGPPHRLYNLGNNRPEPVTKLVALLEQALGRTAIIEPVGMQPGDVEATAADITESARDLGFAPSTPLEIGIPDFVAWYRGRYPA
ncbi:UDP-glucuronate 4-epimerase [Stella humosa]|uniref:UDP-glucuronate 4-epimerase n=1 Tax=Stella humosa TaxID=94 RepID=A0A3N1KY38_9PROT|nr:NAD-dependent epimerase/dehydratase family protein [Stella humosa]ROP83106.1 UDP-glucuronate 4-epimerase [Stella humosa]BBK30117.1 NAD-dependent epimerase [Stella humosa]